MAAEMDDDPDFDNALREKATEAARRWRERRPVREQKAKAVEEGRPLDADTRPRLALRLNRLINEVRSSSRDGRVPDNPTLQQLIKRPTPLAPEDLSDDLVNEVVTGVRNFLSVEFLARGITIARRVGRILIGTGGGLKARGTGFLIGRGIVLTNEHVLRSREQAAACSIQMDYEQNRFSANPQPQIFAFEPGRLFLNDPELDFAIVAVAPKSNQGAAIEDYGWLTLDEAQGKITVNAKDFVNIIQHPLGREKEVVVRDNRLLDLSTSNQEPNPLGAFLHYEADTEKGSSGSPVLNDSWEVVALHHTGVPVEDDQGRWLDKEGHVWNENTQSPADIAWRGNEGVRVSSLIAALSQAQLDPPQAALLKQVLAKTPSPATMPMKKEALEPREPTRPADDPRRDVERSRPRRPEEKPARNAAEIELPLRISISVGEARYGGEKPYRTTLERPPERLRPEVLEEALSPEEYADREGYDRRFLGINVPFPVMKERPRFGGVLRVPRPARPRDVNELRYHRFSIIMNKGRRLAYVSACNVNFNPPATVTRDEGSQSWRRDPRVDPEHQLGGPFYDDNDYDKGHLTRRDDAAWGRDTDDALIANWDTFHYTNAAPQHFLFNRSDEFTGANLDLWGDLEKFISEQGEAQRTRLSIFNGPIFGDRDKPLRDALVPWSFFKIVIWHDRNQPPGALGFVLDQRDLIQDLPEEAIEAGRFSIRQQRISRIERDLDISFGPVTGWDQMPPSDPHEALEEEGIEINRPSDIRMMASRIAPRSLQSLAVRPDAEALDDRGDRGPADNVPVTEEKVRAGFVELNDLAMSEYHQTLAEILATKDKSKAAIRVGRLVGVLLKEPFAKAETLESPSRQTSAYRAWNLNSREDFRAAAASRPWQRDILEWMRQDLERQGTTFEDIYTLAQDAQHETGFFALFARTLRDYVCGDQAIRKKIDDAFKKISKLGKAPTPETVMGAGGLTLGVYLVQIVPALGMAGAPVIAAVIVILYILGVDAFCKWSKEVQSKDAEK